MGLGTIIGAFASEDAADNERKVQAANQAAWAAYQAKVQSDFEKSRGSQGNAILPLYFGTGDQSFEKQAATDYTKLYNGLPDVNLAGYQNTVMSYMPMRDASRGALADVFNGNLTENRLGYAQPTFQARTDLAKTQQQGVWEGLQQRINALNAQKARQGFTGGGSFDQNRLLGATVGARQQAAGAMANANLLNAQDARGIYDQGASLKLQMLNAPYQQQAAEMSSLDAPARGALQAYLDRIRPMDAFRIGTATPFAPTPMPTKPIPTDSQIWLQAGADLAKEAEDTAKQAASAYFGGGMGGMGGGGGGGGGSGGSSGVPTYTGSQYGGWGYGQNSGYMPMNTGYV